MFHRFFELFGHRTSRPDATRQRRRPIQIELLEGRDLPACLVPANTCFAVIGDFGKAGPAEEAVANLVKSWNPDFIITTGDNNYEDGAASTIDQNIGQYYHEFIFPYRGTYGAGASTNRFFPVLGNHDWETPGAQPYLDYFTLPDNERYFDFSHGPVEFFALDSDDHEPDGNTSMSIQANWLRDELAASRAVWKIVYLHHPPFSSGAVHGSEFDLQWPFEQWGATAVLSGHDHVYERILINGFPYFVNGLGGNNITAFGAPISGSQARYNGDHGAMLVDASDNQISFQFVTRTGSAVDSYTITRAVQLPSVTISAPNSSASEPDDPGRLTVSRTGNSDSSLTVHYAVTGTALAGSDYNSLSGSVTIPAGSASANIDVTPRDDSVSEGTETVTVTLSSDTAYLVGSPASATVNLSDNDDPVRPTVTVSVVDGTASEKVKNTARVKFRRTGKTNAPLSLSYTVGGTASATDYAPLSGSLTIPKGASGAKVTVTAQNDSVFEGTETVIVTLSNSSLYNRGTPATATISIADNDVAGSLLLVPTGSVWRYLDNGSDQGTSWRGVDFDDSTWKAGRAQLGYGDGDENTTVSAGLNGNSKNITTYFRRVFTIADASQINQLRLRLLRDDGAVVYLNGTSVLRSNMPPGTITHTTLASAAVRGSAEDTFFESAIDVGLLRNGANVIAVEIHQSAPNSSDISFDLELVGRA